jgi:hypothetical protein
VGLEFGIFFIEISFQNPGFFIVLYLYLPILPQRLD